MNVNYHQEMHDMNQVIVNLLLLSYHHLPLLYLLPLPLTYTYTYLHGHINAPNHRHLTLTPVVSPHIT